MSKMRIPYVFVTSHLHVRLMGIKYWMGYKLRSKFCKLWFATLIAFNKWHRIWVYTHEHDYCSHLHFIRIRKCVTCPRQIPLNNDELQIQTRQEIIPSQKKKECACMECIFFHSIRVYVLINSLAFTSFHLLSFRKIPPKWLGLLYKCENRTNIKQGNIVRKYTDWRDSENQVLLTKSRKKSKRNTGRPCIYAYLVYRMSHE
jgi:hypothetical protein